MLFSHKHKFVYMAPPKTGTTTLTTVLKQDFEAQVWDFTGICPIRTTQNTDIKEKGCYWPRHIVHLPEEIKDYFVFATTRNPYRHAMSQYYNLCIPQNIEPSLRGFYEALKHNKTVLYHLLRLSPNYEPPKGCVKFKIHKFLDPDDKFEENFNSLPFVKEPITLPHCKQSPNARLFYTQEMADIILKRRKLDFEFFGYNTEIPEDLREPKCSS